jgi:hypothetical protein
MICSGYDNSGDHYVLFSGEDITWKSGHSKILTDWCSKKTNHISNWADLDGDGKVDLLCDNPVNGKHWAKISRGDGAFSSTLDKYL